MRSRWLLAAVVAAVLGLCLALPSTGGALVGRITNGTNTAGVAVFGTCTNTATATGSAFFVHPFDEASGTVARDVSGNTRPGTYQNPGAGQITYGAAGPCPRDGGKAVRLASVNVANLLAGGYITSNTLVNNPQVFSASIWFQTTSTTGGKLIGFGNTASGSSASYDRHLYVTNAGNVVAGVYPNTVKTVTSPLTYRDGTWHHAVMTLSAGTGDTGGLRLYVDGALVASDATTTSAQVYNGYWRMGYDNLASWTSAPTSYYFTGSLAYAAVFNAALTPLQVSALYAAGR